MRKPTTTELLAGFIIVLSLALLIGKRFDVSWAGGEGFKSQATFVQVDSRTPEGEPLNTGPATFFRGEILQTTTYMRQFRTYGYDYPCDIWLDQNTQVVIENAQENETTFSLITGRIFVDCKATIKAREAKVAGDGVATFVNYSWLHRLDVKAIEGSTTATLGDQSIDISGSSASMDTIDATQTITTPIEFSLDSPSVSEFYKWATYDSKNDL